MAYYKIPFGKHAGKELKDIPMSYILWLADQRDCPPQVKKYAKRKGQVKESHVAIVPMGPDDKSTKKHQYYKSYFNKDTHGTQ